MRILHACFVVLPNVTNACIYVCVLSKFPILPDYFVPNTVQILDLILHKRQTTHTASHNGGNILRECKITLVYGLLCDVITR